MSAKEWAGEHEGYDKRAMTCLERYAEIEHGNIGSEYELELVLREAQVWATLAGAAASRLMAEVMPGVRGPVRIDDVARTGDCGPWDAPWGER
jgi:hypothetical protein